MDDDESEDKNLDLSFVKSTSTDSEKPSGPLSQSDAAGVPQDNKGVEKKNNGSSAANGTANNNVNLEMLTSINPNNISGNSFAAFPVSKQANGVSINTSDRTNVDGLLRRLQRSVGKNWERYRDTLAKFLIGKLSRIEFSETMSEILSVEEMHTHNCLVLSVFANTFRESPPGDNPFMVNWKHSKTSAKTQHMGTPAEMLQRDILALPVRERKRIRNICRENVKRPAIHLPPPSLVATREAILPKIPYVQDKEKGVSGLLPSNGNLPLVDSPLNPRLKQLHMQLSSLDRQDLNQTQSQQLPSDYAQAGVKKPVNAIKNTEDVTLDSQNDVAFTGSLHPARTSSSLTWTQDIIHSFDVPLASESFDFPDDDSIGPRMLGIALENGLTAGIDVGTTDIMLCGLEAYLQTLVQALVDTLKHRRVDAAHPITAKDFDTYLNMRPSDFQEISAPLYRLKTYLLQDEESLLSQTQEEALKSLKKAEDDKEEVLEVYKKYPLLPLQLVQNKIPLRKHTDLENECLAEAKKGIDLIAEILDKS